MKKLILLLILLTPVLFVEGCTDKTQANSANSDVNLEASNVLEVTSLEQINTSLQEGPVFLRIGSEWCSACRGMKPILKDLATEYEGKVTVISVDVDQSPDIAEYFNVTYIPDSFVIMGIENGEYVFMQSDGSTSTDRSEARVVGYQDKEVFEEFLVFVLSQDGGNNSNETNIQNDLNSSESP